MPATSAPEGRGAPQPSERRLESWGEIASYLHREIRTVQRWERNLGLPVHRLRVGQNASVFAYPSELDKWFQEREEYIKNDKQGDSNSGAAGASAAVSAAGGSVSDAPISGDAVVISPAGSTPASGSSVLPATGVAGYGGAAPSAATQNQVPARSSEAGGRNDNKWTKWAAGAAIILIAGFVAVRFALTVQPGSSVPASGKLRLFVRPFQTIAGDSSQAEFTEGLTSEMITRLARIDPKRLGVIAPTSSKQLGGKPISDLESLLKLNFVLEGTVWRVNEKVRINVSLVSAKDQTPVWSDSYTENVTDILKVQDEVAEAVAQKLLLSLPSASWSGASVDPQGYTAYLRGRRYWSMRDLGHSVPAFQEAVSRMPDYALAHSGLAASYALLGEAPNDAVVPTSTAPKARAEALQALTLDPNNAEAHFVLGNLAMSFDYDFPAAERELRQAISIEPNNPTAHQWLGQYFMTQNRLNEAQAETSKALELDPVSPIFTTTRAEAFYYAHDFDSTIAQANLTLEQSPQFLLGEFWLASAHREKKMYAEALQHFRVASALAPGNAALLSVLGHAEAVSGEAAGARKVLGQLEALSHQHYVPALYPAVVNIGLGDRDKVFKYFDRAVDEHDDRLIYLAVEPLADPLRSDPRFERVLRRVHLH